jgi:hypothetical protein
MTIKDAKSKFDTVDKAVKRAVVVEKGKSPFEQSRVLKVSFDGEPILHTELIESVKREDNLRQVQNGDSRDLNQDKMPILYFVEE